ncbi:MAG TPA: glycoside hydrolase family 3 C-terminal domain-containing protein, partial [Pyrinomonadaceae bacterium]|nr:glycoside hydrolase family 3 C-terminal domain-containing protein [Pyrinomonadaceae bacterium]
YLLNKILKGEWGFKGLVVSDWNAVHSTRGSVLGGLDLEMGTVGKPFDEFYLARPFLEGVRGGEFPASVLDDKVRRNLRVMFATRAFDAAPPGAINTKAHQETARRVAEESFVLLKNDGNALPLNADKLKSIAVVGENAVRLQAYGGGSSRIKAFYEIPPLEGILRRAGERVNVTYSAGYGEKATADAVERALRAASQADAVVYVGGLNHARGLDSEGEDRKDLKLPYGQDELIRKLVEANPRTVVVLLGGGPVEMGPWLARVPAVLYAWYPGMEGGSALARVLFGDVSPSGKLPCTFPVRLEDSPAHALGAYPGRGGVVRYEEGLLVGYRWFDTKRVAPLFPFGHGLSYTRFEYSGLKLVAGQSPKGPVLAVTFDLKNAGDAAGAEVAQVYVRDAQSALPRPLKELKGFSKVFLKPGETQTVRVVLDRNAFAFYDPDKRAWVAERGDFRVMVGGSSRDVKLEGDFSLARTTVEK